MILLSKGKSLDGSSQEDAASSVSWRLFSWAKPQAKIMKNKIICILIDINKSWSVQCRLIKAARQQAALSIVVIE